MCIYEWKKENHKKIKRSKEYVFQPGAIYVCACANVSSRDIIPIINLFLWPICVCGVVKSFCMWKGANRTHTERILNKNNVWRYDLKIIVFFFFYYLINAISENLNVLDLIENWKRYKDKLLVVLFFICFLYFVFIQAVIFLVYLDKCGIGVSSNRKVISELVLA